MDMPFWSLLLILVCRNVVVGATPSPPLFPAMFVFGDSLVDNGNNNYLNSLAKANYVPYGIDFPSGPSGRFSNGKTLIDLLGELLGLPYLPAFANTFSEGSNVSSGINYASAAAGFLDETGLNLGDRVTIGQQVQNFETTLKQLRNQMGDNNLSQHLAKSLVVVHLGSNDYINNYLLPELYGSSLIYNPQDYADLLIGLYKKLLLDLQGLGLRKFLLGALGPLGCIPNQLAIGLVPPGQCNVLVNEIVSMFNDRLKSLVKQLNSDHPRSIYVYGNSYGAFSDMINYPNTYGFSVVDRACCGVGRNQGQITCLPLSVPCSNRDQFVFWDAFHPTQAVHEVLAHRAFSGPISDCYPINVQQMAYM
ncbi:GDSL esterase/lipase At5g08460-like [Prosopis cineraria]|uniref:GDSL esterase/lipase At5g08460-like n=1 Tax=Prosopis cineraria TaxID=364024 RepID=UPI00240F1A8D|nr:GDSL esterase/lipase At5g08460-like [Prosopis cineraria]